MARVDELMELIPAALRSTEEERAALRGMLGPLARLEAWQDVKRGKLGELYDADLVPDELVRHLAAHVGLGEDLPAAFGEELGVLRRLIVVAVALWKRKGSRRSWRDVISTLTGRRAMILDWFALRALDGSGPLVHALPATSTVGADGYSYPELVTDVWIDDPDEAEDLATLARWLDVVRPAGERINLRRALLLEDGLARLTRWDVAGTDLVAVEYDAEAHEIDLVADFTGGVLYPAIDGTAWTDYGVALTYRSTNAQVSWRVYDDGAGTFYEVWVSNGSASAGLYRSGTFVAFGSLSYPWPFGTDVRVHVQVQTGTTTTTVRVWAEGLLLIEYHDVDGARPVAGTFGVRSRPAFGGVDRLSSLSNVLIYKLGQQPTRVGPDP